MNQTQLTFLLPTLRMLLGDWDPVARQYSDQALINGLQAVLLMNGLPGYTLTPDNTAVTPAVTGNLQQPTQFALLVFKTVQLFVRQEGDRYSYKTRAMSESFGSRRAYARDIDLEIWQIESGSAFSSWQSYHCWVQGCAGVPVGLALTNVNVQAPFYTANVSMAGVNISPSSPAM